MKKNFIKEKYRHIKEFILKKCAETDISTGIGILGNVITVLTFCFLNYTLAKYEGNGVLYNIALAAIAITVLFVVLKISICISSCHKKEREREAKASRQRNKKRACFLLENY